MYKPLLVLLSLSLSGTVLAGLVALIRLLLAGRTPRRLICWLWLLVLLRFCLPLPSPIRVLIPDRPLPALMQQSPQQAVPEEAEAAAPDERPQLEPSILPGQVWTAVYLIGAAALLTHRVGGYVRMRRVLMRTACAPEPAVQAQFVRLYGGRRLRLLVSSGAVTPMLMGLFRPVLVLPAELGPGRTLHHALLHELSHYRRGDIWLKWFATITNCLHWFNPVTYLICRQVGRACELACDEAVIGAMTPQERRQYGETLLLLACGGPSPAGALAAGFRPEQARLKERLIQIMKYTKPRKGALAVAAVLTLLLVVGGVMLGPVITPVYAAPSQATDAQEPEAVPESGSAQEPEPAGTAEAGQAQTVWPVPTGTEISSAYGTRIHPVLQVAVTHDGIDIPAADGDPVLAAAAGTVIQTGFEANYGNYIRIDHGDGRQTLYAHLSEVAVESGSLVAAGDTIGSVGQTGFATGPHLHLGLQVDGASADPMTLFE